MSDLQFIGIGSAFNTQLGNTCAFIKKNNSLVLIDCGATVFSRLQELGFLDELKNIYIVITHTHSDHIGSIGDIVLYSHYILKQKANIYFPDKKLIEGVLKGLGVKNETYNLNNLETVIVNNMDIGNFTIEFTQSSHVKTIPSYSFIMKLKDTAFYYSGDSNNISKEIIDKLKGGEISKIYQDTCGLDYDENSHLSLRKLCDAIPKELRSKVYCMHLDKEITNKEIEDNGFNVAEIYK